MIKLSKYVESHEFNKSLEAVKEFIINIVC